MTINIDITALRRTLAALLVSAIEDLCQPIIVYASLTIEEGDNTPVYMHGKRYHETRRWFLDAVNHDPLSFREICCELSLSEKRILQTVALIHAEREKIIKQAKRGRLQREIRWFPPRQTRGEIALSDLRKKYIPKWEEYIAMKKNSPGGGTKRRSTRVRVSQDLPQLPAGLLVCVRG